jgi:hypothetical protein
LKTFLLLPFIISLSLGATEPLEFPLKFNLPQAKSFLKHTGPVNHVEGIDSNRNFTDLDADGVFDLLDSDIDGDGVSNFMDLNPLDKDIQGEDRDEDGIPDFLDFKVGEVLKENMDIESAAFQERLFKGIGLLIFNGDFPFTNREFKRLASLYLSKELRLFKKAEALDVIFKQPIHPMGYRGKYRSSHRAIVLYSNEDHKKNPLHQELTLVHENFHALIESEPKLFQEFLDLTRWKILEDTYSYQGESFPISLIKTDPEAISRALTSDEFPSDYAKLGPMEMFAECATASLMNHREEIKTVKYPYLDKYLYTPVHSFILASFQTVLK